jgi:hypothetical protein
LIYFRNSEAWSTGLSILAVMSRFMSPTPPSRHAWRPAPRAAHRAPAGPARRERVRPATRWSPGVAMVSCDEPTAPRPRGRCQESDWHCSSDKGSLAHRRRQRRFGAAPTTGSRRGRQCLSQSGVVWTVRTTGCPADVLFYTDVVVTYPASVPPHDSPSLACGVPDLEWTTDDGLTAAHYSARKPFCQS